MLLLLKRDLEIPNLFLEGTRQWVETVTYQYLSSKNWTVYVFTMETSDADSRCVGTAAALSVRTGLS